MSKTIHDTTSVSDRANFHITPGDYQKPRRYDRFTAPLDDGGGPLIFS